MAIEPQDTVGGDLPTPLGGGHVTAASAKTNSHADVFIDGLALNLHITPNTSAYGGSPYMRVTADQMKPQYDTAPIAGEHSLSQYWIRSQMSLHNGAGVKYLDTNASDVQNPSSPIEYRYDTSRGVDVWTKGEFKRLPDTSLLAATAGKTWLFATTLSNGESYLVYGSAGSVKAMRQNAGDTITYTITGMAGTIKDMVIDGANYYVATNDGHIYSGPIDNSAAGTSKWDFTSSSDVTLGWSKQRLMAGINNAIYELAGTGPTLPTATYTHPNTAWRWTSFSEGPNSVVASGAAGTQSTIYAFTLDTSLSVPKLQAGIPIAMLPVGEVVNCLYAYTGQTLVIGTSVGLRVGVFQSFQGTFSYGSLTYPSRLEDSTPVTSISGRGSYVYAGTTIDGEASLIRVDLGTQTDQGIYAWAPDLRPPVAVAGVVSAITVDSSRRLRFAVTGYGVVGETTTYTGRPAWLRTARIRFNTTEGKHFKFGQIRASGSAGSSVNIQATTDVMAIKSVYTYDVTNQSERFGVSSGSAEWCTLTFNLTGDVKVSSYQLLALPAGPRARLITLPVQIFDNERSRHGQTVGGAGRAKKLLDTLEAFEANGDELTLQVPCLGIDAVRVTVEKFTFMQTSNPAANKKVDVGGYGTLVFRTAT